MEVRNRTQWWLWETPWDRTHCFYDMCHTCEFIATNDTNDYPQNVWNPSLRLSSLLQQKKKKKKKKGPARQQRETVRYRDRNSILRSGLHRQRITIITRRLLRIITCLFVVRSVPAIAAQSLRPGTTNGNSPLAHMQPLLRGLRTTGRATSWLLPQPLRSRDTSRTRCLVVMPDPRTRVARRRACCTLRSRRRESLSPSWDSSRWKHSIMISSRFRKFN